MGLNLVYLVPGQTGGMETYARELIPSLLAESREVRVTAFVNNEAWEGGGPWRDIPCVRVPVDARKRSAWVWGEQMLLPPLAAKEGVDVLHSLASTAPARGPFRRIVTIHDLIYRIHPEAHFGLRSTGMRVLVPLAARRSHRIIVPSESTRRDVERFLHAPATKLDVIHEGVALPIDGEAMSEADLRRAYGLGGRPILLTAAAKRPHKNLLRLLDAIALVPLDFRPVLVLPGYPTPHEEELRSHAAALGIEADTRFLGWIPAAELDALYRAARGFVFPSLYEGFGLPVLEAMARGVPVLCSDRASLPEVAGTAALFFDPEQPAAIADAIATLLGDPTERERLREAGLERARQFTWARTARATIDSYGRALGQAIR